MNARVKSDEIVFVGKSSKAILKESCDDVSRVLFAFGGVLSLSLFFTLSLKRVQNETQTFQRERRGRVERKPLDVVVLRLLVAERTSTPPRERENRSKSAGGGGGSGGGKLASSGATEKEKEKETRVFFFLGICYYGRKR